MPSRRAMMQYILGSSASPQLAAPTISLSGDILSIEEVEDAEHYDIYVDGVLEESVPAVSGYQVTLSEGSYPFDFNVVGALEYSIDGGTTWNAITSFPLNVNASQIMFRGYTSDTDFGIMIGTTEGSADIFEDNQSGTMQTSSNITLSEAKTFYFSINFAD